MSLLKNKIAVLTGAAKGIGASTSLIFAKNGAKGLVIVYIDAKRANLMAEEIIKETDCFCIAINADFSCENDVNNVIDLAINKLGAVDILVNSAGICRITSMNDLTMEQWGRTMDINLKGTFLFSRSVLKHMMKKESGKIINVASQAGKIGGIVVGPDYPASKAAAICLTKTLAKAAAPFNVNVNSVAPGLINTEMTQEFEYKPESIPLGRIGTPEEVADVILFLASDMSRYISGACIDVNGGMTMW